MAEVENKAQQVSARDKHLDRLRKKYPDKKFEDDEEIYGQIGSDYDEYESRIGNYESQANAMSDMFNADPRSAAFLNDIRNGQDPVLALAERFGPEVVEVMQDPSRAEEVAESNKKYLERVAKSRELDAQYDQNMPQSLETLAQFQQERGLTDEQCDQIIAALFTIVNDGVVGKFSAEVFDLMSKAVTHDQDVADASEEGNVAGRNARITEKLRKRQEGDGLAPLGGKNNGASAKKGQSIFDLAGEAG